MRIIVCHWSASEGTLVAAQTNTDQQIVVFERGTWIAATDVPESDIFRGLGLAIARGPAALASLKAAGNVTDAIPLLPTSTSDLRIARALDLVAGVIMFGQNPGAPSEFVVGGRPADRPGYPALDRDGDRIIASKDGLETQPTLFGVVNMSFEPPSALAPIRAGDIVQVSTWALARASVVVAAAGNRGRLSSHESVSAWSEVPWVIGVGSMDDEAGTVLSARSSRGIPERPDSGPDCVAYGASRLNSSMVATSFAAPRVAAVASLCVAAI
ncbi:MAG: S8 family serine peptidase, partial [Cryobacterium sp.]